MQLAAEGGASNPQLWWSAVFSAKGKCDFSGTLQIFFSWLGTSFGGSGVWDSVGCVAETPA